MLTVLAASIPQRFVKPAFQNISDWLFYILSKKSRSVNEDLRQKLKKQKQILHENAETVIKISCNWVGSKEQYAQPLAPLIHLLRLIVHSAVLIRSLARSLTRSVVYVLSWLLTHSLIGQQYFYAQYLNYCKMQKDDASKTSGYKGRKKKLIIQFFFHFYLDYLNIFNQKRSDVLS